MADVFWMVRHADGERYLHAWTFDSRVAARRFRRIAETRKACKTFRGLGFDCHVVRVTVRRGKRDPIARLREARPALKCCAWYESRTVWELCVEAPNGDSAHFMGRTLDECVDKAIAWEVGRG